MVALNKGKDMKHLRKFFLPILVIVVLAGTFLPVSAANYHFQVPKEEINVLIQEDGTLAIEYSIQFRNDPSADAIDFVDIGMPNHSYNLKNASAEIDGVPISHIQNSQYVVPGIELGLGDKAIPAGQTGTVHFLITGVKNTIYPADPVNNVEYASLMFSPTWFDSSLISGSTEMTFTLFLPKNIQSEEPRFFDPSGWPGASEPTSGYSDDGHPFYRWSTANASAGDQYTFGASFPASYLPAGAVEQKPYVPPSTEYPSNYPTGGFSFNFDTLCPAMFCLIFLGVFGVSIYAATVGAKKRKLQYLPPKISIEGHGIKRGLTAVEAAILMEQPLDRVLTMILFALLKKNAATVVKKDPLTITPSSPLPEGLSTYETDFVAAFQSGSPAERRKLLQDLVINLVKSVGEKMKGFSRKESVAYYEDIMRRAWSQVEAAETPEVKGQVFDEVMDWTMLDRDFNTRTTQTFTGPVFIPTPSWWHNYDPTYTPAARTTGGVVPASAHAGGISKPATGGISMPHLPGADFAASIVNGISGFSAGVIGDITGFTSSVTNRTNPIPKTTSSSSRGFGGGGGGHSCACACACAGCACACAGGGR